jgi:hypothetical protein
MYISIIPALGRPREEDHKFKASLGYTPVSKNQGQAGRWWLTL